MQILVVDDSVTILKVVTTLLSQHGFEVKTARDGVQALAMIRQEPAFDLLLVDFVMPMMNGYQLCRELRANEQTKSLPVVLMSAKGDRIREQFVQNTGAIDAITKPFDAFGLLAVVEGALAKTKAGRAPIVPEGETMPDDPSLVEEESRSSLHPGQLERRAIGELAKHAAAAIGPAILELSPEQRGDAQAVSSAVTRALTETTIEPMLVALREALSGATSEVISGDLSLIPLAEVLQLLSMQKQSGIMRVSTGSRVVMLTLGAGLIDFAHTPVPMPEFRLGRYFVEIGALNRTEADVFAEAAARSGRRLGDEVVFAKRVTQEQRQEALRRQTCELVYDLVRFRRGRFWFTAEPPSIPALDAKLGLAMAGLVLEGFRRVDEWRLMEETIVWDQIVVIDAAARARLGEQLTDAEERVIKTIDGRRTLDQVVEDAEIPRFDAVKIVYQFLSSRVLRPMG